MRLNAPINKPKIYTHEGAPAKHISVEAQLRRSVMSCLLWESEFYEDGQSIADRIVELARKCDNETIASMALEARHTHGLRHVPLMLLTVLIERGGSGVANTITSTIRRADEITELVAIYWRNGKRPLSKQMKLGLAKAFHKFSEYQLAKYDRDGPVKLRDVLFLSHAKPKDEEQEAIFKRLVDGKLATPDTWETNLSAGADKKETFERLMTEGKLGYLAVLRNLRNMVDAGCDMDLIKRTIIARKGAFVVFPFRYIAAARAVPQLEPVIDQALCEEIASGPALKGKTIVLVDVSASMLWENVSARSDMTRMDAAAALGSVINGDLRVFSFSHQIVEIPPRRGLSGVDAILSSQHHGGTDLGHAINAVNGLDHDRLIVITDEQSQSRVPDPVANKAYMINVASAKNGIGYGKWIHIDGFSESVIKYITEIENDR